MPGNDPDEAARVVVGELAIPHLPELPANGLGADMVGRSTALLVDLAAEAGAHGWRLASSRGRDARLATLRLSTDVDAFVLAANGTTSWVKTQCVGPLTLASELETRSGHKAVGDAGLRRDLAQSLAEGVREHVAELRRRLPGAAGVVLQLDEPSLPRVLAGLVPTASGLGRLSAVGAGEAAELLRLVLDAGGAEDTVVHCCAGRPPWQVLARTGTRGVSFDLTRLDLSEAVLLDTIGALVEDGRSLWLGAVPSIPPVGQPVTAVADAARTLVDALWARLSFDPAVAAERTVITPTCGLAGASAQGALDALRATAMVGPDR